MTPTKVSEASALMFLFADIPNIGVDRLTSGRRLPGERKRRNSDPQISTTNRIEKENHMQDQWGTIFETPDGKAPSHYGSVLSIYTPNGGLVPGTWQGTNGAQKL